MGEFEGGLPVWFLQGERGGEEKASLFFSFLIFCGFTSPATSRDRFHHLMACLAFSRSLTGLYPSSSSSFSNQHKRILLSLSLSLLSSRCFLFSFFFFISSLFLFLLRKILHPIIPF